MNVEVQALPVPTNSPFVEMMLAMTLATETKQLLREFRISPMHTRVGLARILAETQEAYHAVTGDLLAIPPAIYAVMQTIFTRYGTSSTPTYVTVQPQPSAALPAQPYASHQHHPRFFSTTRTASSPLTAPTPNNYFFRPHRHFAPCLL